MAATGSMPMTARQAIRPNFEADGNGYYVYYFIATSDNDYATVNARQILVSVTNDTDSDGDGTNDTISDEAWQTAKNKADELLQQWRDGDATEDSFGELAKTSSADSTTSTNGGLVENLSHNNFGDERDAWCYDTQRKPGDCEIIKTDSGYAILYYVGPGENRRANPDPHGSEERRLHLLVRGLSEQVHL